MAPRFDDMTPRIAFAGSSGTGKTTLAKYVAEHLKIPFNPVGARSVAESLGFIDEETGEPRPYDVDRASLLVYREFMAGTEISNGPWPNSRRLAAKEAIERFKVQPNSISCRGLFQAELMRQKIEWEVGHFNEGFVTDRTACDQLVYGAIHDIRAVDEHLVEMALRHTESYTHIFVTPSNVFRDGAQDGARVNDETYHRIFDMFLEGTLQEALLASDSEDYNMKVWHLGMADLGLRKDYLRKVCLSSGFTWR